jgi:ABC-type phosphate/phosphonate transport system substrate-binding protein
MSNITTRRTFLRTTAVATASLATVPLAAAADAKIAPLTLIVCDPLSKELACPCVGGYAQRDYAQLGTYLTAKLGRTVEVHFAESLTGALTKKTGGKADIIIGKDSVMIYQAKENKLEIAKIAALNGLDGDPMMTGLIVVPATDPVLSADQLKDYKVLFGPESAVEKHAVPMALLKELNVTFTHDPKAPTPTCSACATTLLELAKSGEKACGVVSSYAMPLLEGCGTIKKGDLKVIGKTDAVPFISVFTAATVNADLAAKIKTALFAVGKDETLSKALETKGGFVEPATDTAKKK